MRGDARTYDHSDVSCAGFRISLFSDFFDFWEFSGFFCFFFGFLGPGGFREGPGVHLDSYGQSFSPNGAILGPLGPIFVFRFFGNPSGAQIAPTRVLVPGPSGALGPWRPKADITEAEGRHFGGVWGGGAPPRIAGCVGGRQPPHPKLVQDFRHQPYVWAHDCLFRATAGALLGAPTAIHTGELSELN